MDYSSNIWTAAWTVSPRIDFNQSVVLELFHMFIQSLKLGTDYYFFEGRGGLGLANFLRMNFFLTFSMCMIFFGGQ